MKFSENFKRGWWIVSIVTIVLLLIIRWKSILSTDVTTLDLGLLTILGVLFLVPIFSEMTIWGLTVKQQLDEAKKEIRNDIKEQNINLRAELHNAISVNSQITPQFNLYPAPPRDELLNTIKAEIKSSLSELNIGSENVSADAQVTIPKLSDEITTAFSSRYLLEREVRRIWEDTFLENSPRKSMVPLLNDLIKAGVIPPQVSNSITEVSRIASPAIHGEPTSKEQSDFLKDIVPPLLSTLTSIKPNNKRSLID
jgi:hypothetical protein